MEMMRNPNALREAQRSQDLQMAQLENLPGGFNALQRMFEQVQEPMMEAAQSMNNPNAGASSSGTGTGSASAAPVNPTNTALPNPWGGSPAAGAPGAGQGQGAQGANPFAAAMGMGGMGAGGFNPYANMGGMGGMGKFSSSSLSHKHILTPPTLYTQYAFVSGTDSLHNILLYTCTCQLMI